MIAWLALQKQLCLCFSSGEHESLLLLWDFWQPANSLFMEQHSLFHKKQNLKGKQVKKKDRKNAIVLLSEEWLSLSLTEMS